MQIRGIEGLTAQQIQGEVNTGARFVQFTYCISLLIVSFKRPSAIYFIRPSDNTFLKGLRYTLLSLVLGWWGLPWGIIYTIGCLITNLGGGKNVTDAVMQSIFSSEQRPVFEFEQTEPLALG